MSRTTRWGLFMHSTPLLFEEAGWGRGMTVLDLGCAGRRALGPWNAE
jgi:hypothetical protein